MSGINKVILVGRVGNDPDVRHLSSSKVANFSLATSETWKDKSSGEKQERTEWHRVCFFGALVDVIQKYVGKGDMLYVEGRLQTRKWADKEGIERYTTEIVGRDMQMLGGGKLKSEPKAAPSKPVKPDYPADLNDEIPF